MAYAITTTDNPYNPVTQFDDWYAFDVFMGYNTCAYLARIARTSPELSGYENLNEVDAAIDEIIRINGPELYKKVEIPNTQNTIV